MFVNRVSVKNELQGLSRGIKKSAEVAESAKEALEFLCSQSTRAVKCVTTKGAIIHHASNFSEEEDGVEVSYTFLYVCLLPNT